MKIRICNECETRLGYGSVTQLTDDGIYEVAHYCPKCDIHFQEKYETIFPKNNILNIPKFQDFIRRMQIDDREDIERIREEMEDFTGLVADLLFDLDATEDVTVRKIMDDYGLIL